jgi:hypothetical protein
MTTAASAARVKQLLAGMHDGWDDNSHWSPFYEEIHSALFVEQTSEQIIANWYLGQLYEAGVSTLQDFERLVATGMPLIDIVRTPSAAAFFKQRYNIPDANRSPPATISLKVHSGKTTKTSEMERDEVTIRNIESVVRSEFDIPLAALEFYIGTKTTPLVEVSQLQGATGTISIYFVNLHIGSSKVKSVSDALSMCGKGTEIKTEAKDLLQKKKEIAVDDQELLHALVTLKKLEDVLPISGGCEATRRVYIDPILVAAARIVKGITMEVERNIAAPRANGPVDYLFKCEDRVICITEGKYNDQDKGVVQNIAQLSAVRDCRKRKRKCDEISEDDNDLGENAPFYGIATTYLTWQVTVLHNKKVKVTPLVTIGVGTPHLADDVKRVVELVAGVLGGGKGKASE